MTLLLKIHRGLHSGAKVALPDGEYNVGASEECDIILADPGVREHHMRLRVAKGEAFCLVYEGADVLLDGVEVPVDETRIEYFQEVEAGAARFRIGPDDVEWPEMKTPEVPEPEPAAADGAGGAGAAAKPDTAVVKKDAKRKIADVRRLLKGGVRNPELLSYVKGAGRKYILGAALAVVAIVALVVYLVVPSAAEVRMQRATALLEGRGYTVTADPASLSASVMLLAPAEDAVKITGAVDFARQVPQIESMLAENGIKAVMQVAARDESIRQGEIWLANNDLAMEVRLVGKSRATVYGYAEDAARAAEVFEQLKAQMPGFDAVTSEIINWPAMKAGLDQALTKRGLSFLETAPAPYHVIVTGVLQSADAQRAWREAEGELQGELRFKPRFEWRRPPEEYLRLVRAMFEERKIGLAADLRDRRTLAVSGFARDREVTGRVAALLKPYIDDWRGGTLVQEYTYWDETLPILKPSLQRNNLGDVEILEPGEYQANLMGDLTPDARAEAWQRVENDMFAALKHPPRVAWRKPPPPEDAWLKDFADRLAAAATPAVVVADANSVNRAALNILKEKGRIRVFGAVETVEERRALQEAADGVSYPVTVEVKSRVETIEELKKVLADKMALLTYERLPGNRLALFGYAFDIEAGKTLSTELSALLTPFAGVEYHFTNWALFGTDFLDYLAANGLGKIKVTPEPYHIVAEGERLTDQGRQVWDKAIAALGKQVGGEVMVVWKVPPPPGEARPEDVAARLREMGLDAVLLKAGEQPSPKLLSVFPDKNLIRVAGVVESVNDKLNIQKLYDEGMHHLVIEVGSREEMLRQAERFLAEIDADVKMIRIGTGNILLKGYVLDIATGKLLMAELKAVLTGFINVDSDFTHWADIRPVLVEFIKTYNLGRLYVQPDEFLIAVVGKLETDVERAGWDETVKIVREMAESDVRFSWHETMPSLRLGRFARRKGIAADVSVPAIEAVAIGEKHPPPPTPEEIKQKEEEAAKAEAANWRMRVLEVRPLPGGAYQARIEGSDRWYREGDIVKGYLLVEVFKEGIMLLRDDNIVIYTIDSGEPPQEQEPK